jgi:hypothetical protein
MEERKLRRIITGHNEKGKSTVIFDGPPRSFGTLHEIWETDETPADNKEYKDTEQLRVKLEPPNRGTKFRYFEIYPEDPSISDEELEKGVAAGFASIDASHCRPDTSRSPHMHKTRTIDYIILLDGEVTLLLDDDEIDLKPFDVVIQRGTNHAWICKGSKPALLIAVLIDAKPL